MSVLRDRQGPQGKATCPKAKNKTTDGTEEKWEEQEQVDVKLDENGEKWEQDGEVSVRMVGPRPSSSIVVPVDSDEDN